MKDWTDDPRLPFVIAVILGMIAGVAAKQAVSITSGVYPKPVAILADFLVLGMVFFIVMYIHSVAPKIPLEGIALISAALAMWGPRGIALLLDRFKKSAVSAAQSLANQLLDPVEPVTPPTVSGARQREHEVATNPPSVERENIYGKTAPVRRLRDIVPLADQMPADIVSKVGKLDRADPDYQWRGPTGGSSKGRKK